MKISKLIWMLVAVLIILPVASFAEPMRILWWGASVNEGRANTSHRETLANFLDNYEGGTLYSVDYKYSPRAGNLAGQLASNSYDMLVFDATNTRRAFNQKDLEAVQSFYANHKSKSLMLDGSLWIRNTGYTDKSIFPGVNRSSAGLLINQIEAMRKTGGGIMVGTDHNVFQRAANQIVSAILPDAKFSGSTNPSRDGEFFGDLLLAEKEDVKPIDILRHWEDIPNQGQAPTGQYSDFMGNPVTLYTLVETSDKPGGKRRRTYISATIDPGTDRFAIDGDAIPEKNTMPTRKSPPLN